MKKLGSYFSLSQSLSLGLILLMSFSVVCLQWQRMEQQADQTLRTEEEYLREEQDYETNIDLLSRIPSFGFDNMVANSAFLNFVQYFGDDRARVTTGYPVVPKFFEVAIQRDPLFLDLYPMLSSTITIYSGYPLKSIELLDKGIEAIPETMKPDAYFLWQLKGTDELLFLGKPKEAEHSYRKAAEWGQKSTLEYAQISAERSLRTANFLAENPDSRNAQIGSWFNVLGSAVDERSQALAVQQIQNLGGTVEYDNEGRLTISFPEE